MSTSFLVRRGSFPSRAEGHRWGAESVSFSIAGSSVLVSGLSLLQRSTLSSVFDGGNPSGLVLPVSVFRVERSAFRSFDRRGWSYSLDFDYGPGHTHVVGMDWMARIDWGGEGLEGALWVAEEESGLFHGAFENFLRVYAAHALLLRGGLMVHSAAVISAGNAFLFVGPSGAGKSTVSRLSLESGRTVVSDDLNLIAPDLTLAGSPFRSEIGSVRQGSYPLRGIYRLRKGGENGLDAIGGSEALATLLACAPFVNRSPFLANALWSALFAITRKIPASVLTFRRDGTFWPLLEGS